MCIYILAQFISIGGKYKFIVKIFEIYINVYLLELEGVLWIVFLMGFLEIPYSWTVL